MQFDWINFYSEFADKLLEYKDNRQELINKIKRVYATINIKVPKLESGDEIIDIDPFTVFGLFNKGITNENRIAIINGIAEEFGINSKRPVDFDGIPVLNNLKATFYYFIGSRDEHDIDNIWKVFESAIKLANDDNEANRNEFIKWYDIVHDQLGIRWNLTMGLYWIRPYYYINLDSRNRWYILLPEQMPADFIETVKPMINKVPKASDYLLIRDICKNVLDEEKYEYRTFPELSYYAWVKSEQVNQEIAAANNKKKSNASFLRWFAPLIKALKDMGGSATPVDARNKIVENEQLSDDEVNATRGKNNVNKFENEVAFARSYLVKAGYIDKSTYGIWSLTEAGKTVEMTDELASEIFKNGIADNQNKRKDDSSALADDNVETVRYWIYSPGENSCMWDEFYNAGIMAIGWGEIGDLTAFASKDEIKNKMKELIDPTLSYKNAAHATWQFVNEMKVGDVIFVKKGRNQLVGRGVVASDYEYNEDRQDEYGNVRKVNWTHKGEWVHPGQAAMKTLTDITDYSEYVDSLNNIFEDDSENDVEETAKNYPVYTEEDFLEEVYMDEEDYSKLVGILKAKLRKDVRKYPELKEYRKGGNKQKNKLPVWVAFSYFELGTVTMMYNYLRGDLRKAVLSYSFGKKSYSKKDTEIVDTWLDAVRNLRNYCAHNSMLVGMTSSVVLLDLNDDVNILKADNDLFSRIYALRKLIPSDDASNLKRDIKNLIKRTSVDIILLGVLPRDWDDIYDRIVEF